MHIWVPTSQPLRCTADRDKIYGGRDANAIRQDSIGFSLFHSFKREREGVSIGCLVYRRKPKRCLREETSADSLSSQQ